MELQGNQLPHLTTTERKATGHLPRFGSTVAVSTTSL